MRLREIGKSIGKAAGSCMTGAKRHAPEICVALGIMAGVGAIVTAVTGTIKAKKLIEEKKAELKVDKLTVGETVKTVWKCYIPTASLGIGSAAAIISGARISIDRTAVMGAMYNAGREALNDYKKSTEETVGEETKKEIDKKASEKTVAKEVSEESINKTFILGEGEEIFIDSLTGQMFTTTINKMDKAVNDFNKQLLRDDCLMLSDWYSILDCKIHDAGVGDLLGWHISHTGYLEISYDAIIRGGKPCILISYDTPPKYMEDL